MADQRDLQKRHQQDQRKIKRLQQELRRKDKSLAVTEPEFAALPPGSDRAGDIAS
jgi:hypothetical protein